ncbi:MAG: ATP-binding protein [Anaerolineales bacterium]|nr:ATP-binding protein [Anaerolineales bacterium]
MTLNPPSNLDDLFHSAPPRARLGLVVGGSLSQGVLVKLDPGQVPGGVIEDMAVGRYVVVEGRTGKKFFAIVTDIALDSANPDLLKTPPDPADAFTADVYASELAFGTLNIAPMLLLDAQGGGKPAPVKTVPAHFALVYPASEADVNQVFGAEDLQHFHIGAPLDMADVKVNLDLPRFVERSSGVFGKSGTGKSFITRTILAGIIKADAAVNLIFDMHNDYGWSVKNEHSQEFKGLRQIFPDGRVQVITLDPQTSRHRGSKTDGELHIGLDQIEPEDVEMLAGIIGLSEVQVGALYYLRRKLQKNWIVKLLDENDTSEIDQLEDEEKIQKGTLRAIQRKFEQFRPDRLGFLSLCPPPDDTVDYIFNCLNRGIHIVLEFGVYGNSLAAYVLVANYLTRRIHARYVEQKNKAAGQTGQEPRPLVITIEEAHKFLDPEIAGHTIFGAIARELRKYNVTLLIVDQRPSGIEEEVMSQIGTRVTCLLDNEADIKAVFSGVSGAGHLREVLARLDTQQQALILGHAVPMPVVVKTRDYGPDLYAAVGYLEPAAARAHTAAAKRALYGDDDD